MQILLTCISRFFVGRQLQSKLNLLAVAFVSSILVVSCICISAQWSFEIQPLDTRRVSAQARIEMRIAKAGVYRGLSPGVSRFANAFVSGLGVMGMFSAIVGSMLGVWLDETADHSDDSDGYCYWDYEEWDVDGDVGWEREQHYAGMRELGSLIHR